MNHIGTIKIHDSTKQVLNDVQLWSDKETSKLPNIASCSSISWIKYAEIPLYLTTALPFAIYSNDPATSDYFRKNLLELPLSNNRTDLGMLCKADSDTYLVFYYEDETVKMIVITFTEFNKLLPHLNGKSHPTSNTVVDLSKPVRARTSTVLIDKIIEKKKQRLNPFITTTPLITTNAPTKVDNSLILSSQEQINAAINKIILSGLRMRGLSQNLVTSHNDKLTIKEIHQMTFKAAQFALRKQNYSFNKKSETKKPLRLNDLQDIVESLLQLFVDVE
ncbi:Mitochondrial morphogenesis protein SLD7 [Candida viswanathii]|uniref:Mitochondrial morphogenesis protein SLD7 n=1 Tax=Candida viswanathii TaxID=5486 RepID=A0A367YPQ4_9ASCO|nr:Mitochondrial morphogenesis protein SLD7 [Candida viswanathii]